MCRSRSAVKKRDFVFSLARAPAANTYTWASARRFRSGKAAYVRPWILLLRAWSRGGWQGAPSRPSAKNALSSGKARPPCWSRRENEERRGAVEAPRRSCSRIPHPGQELGNSGRGGAMTVRRFAPLGGQSNRGPAFRSCRRRGGRRGGRRGRRVPGRPLGRPTALLVGGDQSTLVVAM